MMQFDSVRPIADAILYEGCMLYPYRRSALKNQRLGWGFGSLLPPEYVGRNSGESTFFHGEVLAKADENAELAVEVRFLQLGQSKDSGRRPYLERTVIVSDSLSQLLQRTRVSDHSFVVKNRVDLRVGLGAQRCGEETVKIVLRVENLTAMPASLAENRDAALEYSLLAANAIIGTRHGEFISMLEPPRSMCDAAACCRQSGVYPVLAGAPGETKMMLLSPIILYDYPQVAPESRGSFFDGAEIDEMLTLRMLALSDAERGEVFGSTEMGGDILRRTEALSSGEILNLHGALREKAEGGGSHG